MKPIHTRYRLAAALAILALAIPLAAQEEGKAADNSRVNKAQAPTADAQHTGKSDRLTTQQIRKAVEADKGLSMYAHNVKIITRGGMVTLKGPVRSDEEKQKVEADATGVVGADKVSNQLIVKAKK